MTTSVMNAPEERTVGLKSGDESPPDHPGHITTPSLQSSFQATSLRLLHANSVSFVPSIHSSIDLHLLPSSHLLSSSQPPAKSSNNTPINTVSSPLPFPPFLPPHISSLRQSLSRRRSSYPPSTTPGTSLPSTLGGTPDIGSIATSETGFFFGFGNEFDAMAAPPATGRLISSVSPYPSVHDTPTPPTVKLTSHPTAGALDGGGEPSIFSSSPDPQLPLTPGRIAQFGSDLVWKTILSSVVEVQDIGPVAVSRLLHEVWKRGGGDAVTQLSLWSNIFMSLAFQEAKGVTRISAPSPDAALNLKDLYALTVRHWEPAIFAGLLSQHVGDTSSPFTAQLSKEIYGPATPTKAFDETDVQQWMNLTPSGLDIAAFLGTTPKGSTFPEAPITDYFPHTEPTRSSTMVSDAIQNEVINDLITAIEDREDDAVSKELAEWDEQVKEKTKDLALYQLPTPETDRLDSPSLPGTAPHSSQTLPSTRQNSTSTQVLSPETVPPTPTSSRSHPHPSVGWKLPMPIEKFVPPPPMCMFFNPSFKDLQKGKVGLWQGDLVLRGKNGGKFGILIIGEAEASDL
ncbi:hypothetical protein TREMEDRAFT_73458, partial [Tremella mesenterica DSM 1558]|uniref:uncharacterized protein n=1 Tax=Tremella mesenterica (strain ATCC 24925 / CBS 8224 / DSM 1558 / NBRC 9311 / NRRL Y-6157 / RJB 2259-6 / UBC 559-6) TaxID=578456 RepID=UPI0003F498D9